VTFEALFVDGFGEDRRGRRAVAGDVGGLAGDLLHELGAHVLVLVLELDLLGDRDAVLGDGRGAPNFFSMRTLRPRGPSVTLTARASLRMPSRMVRRASAPVFVSVLSGFSAASFRR
jgi:hypothetical protein